MSKRQLGKTYVNLGEIVQALKYYERALNINREVGNRNGESVILYNIGRLYFDQNRYSIALAAFLLARSILKEVQSPHLSETQSQIDTLHKTLGDEQFTTLLTRVEPQASQIVEQALHESIG